MGLTTAELEHDRHCHRRGEPGGPCWGTVAPYVRGNRVQGQHEVALCKGHVGVRWVPSTDPRDLPTLEREP